MQKDHLNNGNPVANEEENLWYTCFKIGVKNVYIYIYITCIKITNLKYLRLHMRLNSQNENVA